MFTFCQTINGWRLPCSFENVGKWGNIERVCYEKRFSILLSCRIERKGLMRRLRSVIVHSTDAVKLPFQVDTGASSTLISGSIARQLGLAFEKKPVGVRFADEAVHLFVRSWVSIVFGRDQIRIPCFVPYPVSRTDRRQCLLGMAGVLGKYLLCMRSDCMFAFRDALPSHT